MAVSSYATSSATAGASVATLFAARPSSYGLPDFSIASMVTASLRATAVLALRLATFPPRAQMRSPWRYSAVSVDDLRRM